MTEKKKPENELVEVLAPIVKVLSYLILAVAHKPAQSIYTFVIYNNHTYTINYCQSYNTYLLSRHN